MSRVNAKPYFLLLVLLFVSVSARSDPAKVSLLCEGNSKYFTDSQEDNLRSTVNVEIDLEHQRLRVTDGLWACNVAEGQSLKICDGSIPVRITDAEIVFSFESKGSAYHNASSLSINRNSGTFTASSFTVALPASNARWTIFRGTSNFNCTVSKKLF